jgi:hypothetical protein
MWIPGASDERFLMQYDFDARGGHWSFVEIELAFKDGVGREAGIATGRTEHVQGHRGLLEKAIPKVQGKASSVLQRPTTKWFFHVQIARSAALRQCICGRTS